MRSQPGASRWWDAKGRGRSRGKTPNDWLAVVDQHHRMVHALSMAAVVHPPGEEHRPQG